MGIDFKSDLSNIWGIQYHPEITYEKMITLINFRKERLLENKSFNDENDLNSHIKIIEDETEINHFAFLGFCGIYRLGPKNHTG